MDTAIDGSDTDLPEQIQSKDDLSFTQQETDTLLERFNTSSSAELTKLKFISKKGASSIVEHRDEHGHFNSVNNLLKIPCFRFLPHKRLVYMFNSILYLADERTQRLQTANKLAQHFSPEETEVILQVFNDCPMDELTQNVKLMSVKSAKKIVDRRSMHGPFENFLGVLEIPWSSRVANSLQVMFRSMLAAYSDPQDVTVFAPADSETILHKLNTLSSKELAGHNLGGNLPEAIVKYREENGLFQSIKDLENVRGIGQKKIQWIYHSFGANDEFKLSPEEAEMVLEKFNSSTDVQLQKIRYISQNRADEIERHRNHHGPFTNVDEISQLAGLRFLGRKRFHEVLRSILPPVKGAKSTHAVQGGAKHKTAAETNVKPQLLDIKSRTFKSNEAGYESGDVEGKPRKAIPLGILKMSTEEVRTILDKFNFSPAFELMQNHFITRDTANAIVTHRREHGTFAEINDILDFLNSDRKKLTSICKSFMSAPKPIVEPLDFSSADTENILNALNNYSVQELAAKKVGKQLSERIVKYREQHGEFTKLEELVGVQGVGAKKMMQICHSIQSPNLKPVLEYVHNKEKLQSVQDLVTIDIGLKHIAWLHMTRDREVLQWTIHDIDRISPMKWEPQTYLSVVKEIVSQLPNIDFYILEHQPNFGQINNKNMLNSFIYVRSLESLFLGLLNADIGHYGNLGAVSVSRNIAARHFELTVGASRASTQPLAKRMLDEELRRQTILQASSLVEFGEDGTNQQTPAESTAPFVMDEQVAKVFHSSTHYEREHLANCLLQAILFFDTIE